MPVPVEFTPEHIQERSTPEEQLCYSRFPRSGEPYRSLHKKNFYTSAKDGFAVNPMKVGAAGPTPGLDLEDPELYYNTLGSASEYWMGQALPEPTKDIRKMRADLLEWGYCLVSEAFSAEQLAHLKQRLYDQADGERLAGVSHWMGSPPVPGQAMPTTQFLPALFNKGEIFRKCVELNPDAVQGGPIVEQLVSESIGGDFIIDSMNGIITHKHGIPQDLHMDQGAVPLSTPDFPLTCNMMFIVDDVHEGNGGTLVVPGSHRIISSCPSGTSVGRLPPAINLKAPGGTVMVFEGRLLHGTGVNKTDRPRAVMVMMGMKPWIRQQENAMLSALPEVLERASRKLLHRLGCGRSDGKGGLEGTWDGSWSVMQRLAMERGEYIRIGELSPNSPMEDLTKDYTYRHAASNLKRAHYQPDALPEVRARYSNPQALWTPPPKNKTRAKL
mmetsp:Transcript_58766/g.129124  ORF Transcript_58766/g.129124 Transcript_58766/m.129124 type:complete len:442 (+) Transcript_58766:102-1427(+)